MMKIQLLVLLLCLYHIPVGESAGACHFFSDFKLDWFDALFACQKKNLCLANIDTKSALIQIEKKLGETDSLDEYWFGLNAYEKYNFGYIASNEPVSYLPPKAKLLMEKPCGFLKPLGEKQFTIETALCSRSKRFVCAATEQCSGTRIESNSLSLKKKCPMTPKVLKIFGFDKPEYTED